MPCDCEPPPVISASVTAAGWCGLPKVVRTAGGATVAAGGATVDAAGGATVDARTAAAGAQQFSRPELDCHRPSMDRPKGRIVLEWQTMTPPLDAYRAGRCWMTEILVRNSSGRS
jgi:hypothetical protein